LEGGRLAHAYLVAAPPRPTGIAFAEQAVAAVFCGAAQRPCGVCPACRQVLAHAHPDVVWIEPEKKARIVGIERIRELQRFVYQTAFGGGWKACVLVGADRLGDDASNAFLKSLEEPPPRMLFLLLTDRPQSVLPTIRSRCQRLLVGAGEVALAPPWDETLLAILSAPPDAGVAAVVGRAGRLKALLGAIKEHVEGEEKQRAGEAAEREQPGEAAAQPDTDVVAARVAARYREIRTQVLRAWLAWERDLLLCVCGGDPAHLHYPLQAETLRRQAARLTVADALRNIRSVEDMHRQMERNVSEDTVITFGCGRLAAAGLPGGGPCRAS
jgi:DNA polymerase-3 subunit delta'